MADCHKKMTFREFRARDAWHDFRCKVCGRTVEMRDWMKWMVLTYAFIISLLSLLLRDWLEEQFGLVWPWNLLIILPVCLVIYYLYHRAVGYWMYCIAWKLAEKEQ